MSKWILDANLNSDANKVTWMAANVMQDLSYTMRATHPCTIEGVPTKPAASLDGILRMESH